jgi:hypothetical protein
MNPHEETIKSIIAEARSGVSTANLPGETGKVFQLLRDCVIEPPAETLLIDLNVKLAQAYSLRRLSVDGVICNYYGMVFMPSGSGKDYPLTFLDKHLMGVFETEFKSMAAKYYSETEAEVQAEATRKYKEGTAEHRSYIVNNRPRFLIPQIGDATYEGFYDYRLSLQHAGFGGAFIKISEFGDYLNSSGSVSNRGLLLTEIVEAYEDGNSDPKMIKMEKKQTPIRGVPVSALFHTSLSNADDREKLRLMKYLSRGGARRFFVAYFNSIPKIDPGKYYEMRKKTQEAIKGWAVVRDRLERVLERGKFDRQLAPGARDLLDGYAAFNYAREGNRSVLGSLHRKALKLSGIISITENPGSDIVNEADVMFAILQCEIAQLSYGRFEVSQNADEVEQLIEFLKEEPKTTMQVRSQNYIHQSKFSGWFEDVIEGLDGKLYPSGFKLVVGNKDNAKTYYIEKLEWLKQ